MTEDIETAVLHGREPISIFGSLDVTTLEREFAYAGRITNPSPLPPDAGSSLLPRGSNVNLAVAGYIVRGL